MPFQRAVTVKFDASTMAKARRALTSDAPIHRAIVKQLQDDAELIASICKEIAEGELHRRQGNRRTPESDRFGRHYHDAFEVEVRDNPIIEAVQVIVKNDHPFAYAIEFGMDSHPIDPRGRKMVFPPPGGAAGSVGHIGTWALNYADKGNRSAWLIPEHPGMARHRIMRRAAERYRDRTSRRRKLSRR